MNTNYIIDYYFGMFFTVTCIAISAVIVFSYFFGLIAEFFEETKFQKIISYFIAYEYRLLPYVITIFLTIAVIYYHGFIKLLYLLPLYIYAIYKIIRSHT